MVLSGDLLKSAAEVVVVEPVEKVVFVLEVAVKAPPAYTGALANVVNGDFGKRRLAQVHFKAVRHGLSHKLCLCQGIISRTVFYII